MGSIFTLADLNPDYEDEADGSCDYAVLFNDPYSDVTSLLDEIHFEVNDHVVRDLLLKIRNCEM